MTYVVIWRSHAGRRERKVYKTERGALRWCELLQRLGLTPSIEYR